MRDKVVISFALLAFAFLIYKADFLFRDNNCEAAVNEEECSFIEERVQCCSSNYFSCWEQNADCLALGFYPQRFTVRHVMGNENCIPLPMNYTTVELLLATDYCPGYVMQMLDIRGHRFDNNVYGLNIGIGGRLIPGDCACSLCPEMLGINFYYDYSKGWLGYFQQISIGLEVLGRCWDFRANAYVPIGNTKKCKTCVFDDYIGDYCARNDKYEQIAWSFNGEVGFLAVNWCNIWFFYVAGGPYFIAGRKCKENTKGVEFRVRPQYKDYIAVDAGIRYDELFKFMYYLEFIFTIPLYQIRCQNKCCYLTDRQIYQPIERFEVLPTSRLDCWYKNW